jgi:hypothetical protein
MQSLAGSTRLPVPRKSLLSIPEKKHKVIYPSFSKQCLLARVPSKIKLDIKPLLMHLLKISIFSLNNDLVRVTKIMNNLVKDLKILSFKVIFKHLKLVESFQKKMCEEYLIRRPTYNNEIFENFDFYSTLFTKKVTNSCWLCSKFW